MRFELYMAVDNAAFGVDGSAEGRDGNEIAKILNAVADLLIADGAVEGGWGTTLHDSNGNRVGIAELK